MLSGQNPDGGFGWTQGKASTTECTSLAVLALASLSDGAQSLPIRRAVDWLLARQNSDGSWSLNESLAAPSWSSAMAMLALSPWGQYRAQVLKGAHWVLTHEGKKPGILTNLLFALTLQKKPVVLNEALTGWPWMAGTFSWVEPTSYFLIALKRLRPHMTGARVEERISQGESMIYDRMCDGGGWNYGNRLVYGEKLWPYVDVTAIALIALQNHRQSMENRVSFAALQKEVKLTNSGLALSWSALCYQIYGEDPGELRELLVRGFEATGFLGETKTLALYILALTGGANYFRV